MRKSSQLWEDVGFSIRWLRVLYLIFHISKNGITAHPFNLFELSGCDVFLYFLEIQWKFILDIVNSIENNRTATKQTLWGRLFSRFQGGTLKQFFIQHTL